MAQKGGKFDASGQPINSWRLVTDTDADTGIGSVQDPVRVDPTGTTVQPVSITGSVTTTGGLTDTQLRASPVPVSAASLPLPTGAALDATLTGGSQKTKIVDSAGTNLAAVSAAGAVKVDGSAVTQPVSGTVTTTPPANASTNVAQVAGATTATAASGVQKVGVVGGAGTSLETTAGVIDQNLKNVGNAAVLTGNGVTGTGSPRVTIASDNTAFQVLAAPIPGTKATYGALASAFTPAATPTDVLVIVGDGTHVIRLVRLTMLAHATAAGAPLQVIIQGRSTLNTGGTSASPTSRAIDQSDSSIGTIATVNRYTVNPTSLGTDAAVSFIGPLPVNASGGTTQAVLDVQFGSLPGAKLPTIRTNTQMIALNFQTVALPAGFGIDYIYVEYTLD